jgi:hypothetical protein
LGLKAAQSGRQCLRLSGVGGEAFQDCCMGCKLGMLAATAAGDGETCALLADVFGLPWNETFVACCEEMQDGALGEDQPGGGSDAGGGASDGDEGSVDVEEATRMAMSRPNKCPRGFRFNSRMNVCDDIGTLALAPLNR